MRLSYIGIFRSDPKTKAITQLCVETYLNFFETMALGSIGGNRAIHKELMVFYSKKFAKDVKPGQKNLFESEDPKMKDYKFYVHARTEGVVGVLAADAEYPEISAHGALAKILEEFLNIHKDSDFSNPEQKLEYFPQLKGYLIEYQDPTNVDNLQKIQRELDETKDVIRQTIESVLERGEKIDSLVQKSDGLSAQSKMFYQSAKKQNSCCVLM